MSALRDLSWSEALALFSQNKKCHVKTLDTVFVDPQTRQLSWYFTNKSGALSRKKAEKCSIPSIVERFSLFALSNPFNTIGNVAFLWCGDETRKALNQLELTDLLENNLTYLSSSAGSFLQVFLRPHRGNDSIVKCSSERESGDNYKHRIAQSPLYKTEETTDLTANISETVKTQVLMACEHVYQFLRANCELRVEDATLEFIVDDNEHAWLSAIRKCRSTKLNEDSVGSDKQQVSASPSKLGSNAVSSPVREHTAANATDSTPAAAVVAKADPAQADQSPSTNDDHYQHTQPPLSFEAGHDDEHDSEHNGAVARAVTSVDAGGVSPKKQKKRKKGAGRSHAELSDTSMSNGGEDSGADQGFGEQKDALMIAHGEDYQPDYIDGSGGQRAKKKNSNNNKPSASSTAGNVKKDNSKIVSNNAAERKKKQPPAAAGLSRGSNATGEAHSGKQGTGARRSKMDEPPSIELLAKFAAEKERQEQLLARKAAENEENIGSGLGGSKKNRKGTTSLKRSNTNRQQHHQQQMMGMGLGSQIPALDSLDFAERKIEELQKLAATTASIKSLMHQQQQQPHSPPLNATTGKLQPVNPPPGMHHSQSAAALKRPNMSGTEADFLVRQINTADVSQLSLFSNAEEFASVAVGLDSSQQSAAAHSKTTAVDHGKGYVLADRQVAAAATEMNDLIGLGGSESVWSVNSSMGKNTTALHTDPATGKQSTTAGDVRNEQPNGESGRYIVHKMGGALKERIGALETQIQSLQATVQRKESDLERKDQKIRRLNSELEAQRKDAEKEVLKIRNDHELEMLRMREQHSKEKSALAVGKHPVQQQQHQQQQQIQSPSSSVAQSSTQSPSKFNSDAFVGDVYPSASGSSSEANSKLIEQVEMLRAQLRRTHDAFSSERREFQLESSNRLIAQEKHLKAEVVDIRGKYADLEDHMVQVQEELSSAKSRIESLQRVNTQLEVSKQNAVDVQNRLRADLKNMQQSVQASYRLETSQGIGGGGAVVDADTAIRLNDAKNEAKSRQLLNKLEFLKAQLDAEKKAADEARNAMELSQRKTEELREEFHTRIREAEHDKKVAVEEAEQAIELQYHERMKELTTLQMRLHTIEGQLQSVQEQEFVAKQREEQAKSNAAKANAHQAQLRVELDQMRSQLQMLRDEKEREMMKEAGKQNQDAVIRRLDNERQYLKSQLASEITHKNELQTTLTQCQQQLGAVQKQWKSDVETLKDTNVVAQQSFADKQQHFDETHTHLQGELQRLQAQNKELKDGFVKMRDQVRMEQLALENANSTQRRMQENLESARAEINRMVENEQQTAEIHRAQIDAINDSVKQQEKRFNEEIGRLKDELSQQFLENSRAHSASILLRDQFEEQKTWMKKMATAQVIADKLKRWQLARLHIAFRAWNSNCSLVTAAKTFRGQVEALLKKNTKDLNQEKQNALEALRNDLATKHSNAMASRDAEWEETMNDALSNAEKDKQAALQSAKDEHDALMKQAEEDFLADLRAARREGEEEVARAIARKDAQIEELLRNSKVEAELARQAAQARLEESLALREKELNDLMEQELKNQKNQMLKEQAEAVKRANIEADQRLNRREQQLRLEMEHTQKRLEEEHQRDMDEASKAHQEAMQELQAEYDAERAQLTADMQQQAEEQRKLREGMQSAHEANIRKLRTEWQAEFDARSQQQQAAFDEQMAATRKEWDMEKQRAVATEAAKWEAELAEARDYQQREMERALTDLANEKDKELRNEIERVSGNYELKRAKERSEHLEAMAQMRRDHEFTVEQLNEKHNDALEKQRIELEIKHKELHDALWSAKMQSEMAAAEKSWKAKLSKEQGRVEQLKHDLTLQAQNHAAERAVLQRQVAAADERIQQMEALTKAETMSLMKHFEAEKLNLIRQHEDDTREAAEKAKQAQEAAVAETRSQCADEAEKMLAAEKKKMNDDFNEQMNQMQEESDNLISGLEAAMLGLKGEKEALTSELESLTNRLEETEDTLYDVQQECKRVQTNSSLTVWKSVTKIFQMRQRFQQGIAEFDKEAARKYNEIQNEMQNKLNAAELISLKLALLLKDVEEARQSTHLILTAHRTQELKNIRNQIQVMEKDLDRLTMEKDSLEEQRELVDSDIAQMEQQVRAMEEQIRLHNQESSMVNGRINVAHARKKRRLDTELEHLLEAIEHKRANVSNLESRGIQKAHERDNLELEMIDLERQLVQILLEQQKMVLQQLEEGKLTEDKCKVVLDMARLPFPVPDDPTIEFVENLVKQRKTEDREALWN